MSDRTATVSLHIDEWDNMRNKTQQLQNEIAELCKQLAEAERKDPTGRLEPTLKTIEMALPIIQFAVSNLHPDTMLGWPYEALREFSERLKSLPGASQLYKELAIELKAFAAQAEMRARERAARPVVVSTPLEALENRAADYLSNATVAPTAAEPADDPPHDA